MTSKEWIEAYRRHETIVIPPDLMRRAAFGPIEGRSVVAPVMLDIPELRLTEEQVFANAAAAVAGRYSPYPDRNILMLRAEYLESAVHRKRIAGEK